MLQKALRMKLRFSTEKGLFSVEDLWDLSLQHLNRMAKGLNKLLKESKEDDFLEETSEEDTITKLRFDIVIDILETKKAENKARKSATAKKAEREKLLALLARKQDNALEALSEADVLKKLEELDASE